MASNNFIMVKNQTIDTMESGARRDSDKGKPRLDLISPFAEERVGHWLRMGAEKYGERNWEKGIPFSRCIASIKRHLMKYLQRSVEEDHLAAIICNAMFLMHYEVMIAGSVLPDSLNDLPAHLPMTTPGEGLDDPCYLS